MDVRYIAVLVLCVVASRASAFEVDGRVVDQDGRPLSGVTVTLWTQSGIQLGSANSNVDGKFKFVGQDISATDIGPIELLFERVGRHDTMLQQISGEDSHQLSVVMFPDIGPKTYERVVDQLQTYERLYYVIRGASNPAIRVQHAELRTKYMEKILQVPDPDGNRDRDIAFRRSLDQLQIELVRKKRLAVIAVFQ